jgi:hypothetical protein
MNADTAPGNGSGAPGSSHTATGVGVKVGVGVRVAAGVFVAARVGIIVGVGLGVGVRFNCAQAVKSSRQ